MGDRNLGPNSGPSREDWYDNSGQTPGDRNRRPGRTSSGGDDEECRSRMHSEIWAYEHEGRGTGRGGSSTGDDTTVSGGGRRNGSDRPQYTVHKGDGGDINIYDSNVTINTGSQSVPMRSRSREDDIADPSSVYRRDAQRRLAEADPAYREYQDRMYDGQDPVSARRSTSGYGRTSRDYNRGSDPRYDGTYDPNIDGGYSSSRSRGAYDPGRNSQYDRELYDRSQQQRDYQDTIARNRQINEVGMTDQAWQAQQRQLQYEQDLQRNRDLNRGRGYGRERDYGMTDAEKAAAVIGTIGTIGGVWSDIEAAKHGGRRYGNGGWGSRGGYPDVYGNGDYDYNRRRRDEVWSERLPGGYDPLSGGYDYGRYGRTGGRNGGYTDPYGRPCDVNGRPLYADRGYDDGTYYSGTGPDYYSRNRQFNYGRNRNPVEDIIGGNGLGAILRFGIGR